MGAKKQSITAAKLSDPSGKETARRIFLAMMAQIDPRHAMMKKIRREPNALIADDEPFPLRGRPLVVAFGKAANSMSQALEGILEREIERGVVACPAAPARKLERFSYFTGGHPYPSAGSVEAAEAALELVGGRTKEDFVIFLVSGGGSALFEKPLRAGVTLSDLVEFNRALVTCGLPIEKINVLRKHFSAVKGGRLGVAAHPARQLTIYISDVPDGRDSMVASGPTMPDESTAGECYAIARESGLAEKFPASLRQPIERRTIEETPKPGDERFGNSRYFCLLANRDAVEAAKSAAEAAGFVCGMAPAPWDENYREAADRELAALDDLARKNPGRRVALVAGGEVTCPVTGPGVGGRNQAYVLYSAQNILGKKQVVLSAGTDGRDGNSPASGAVADGQTVPRAHALGINPERYLAASDSYSFFRTLGDTVETGFTDNNVRDVRLLLDLAG